MRSSAGSPGPMTHHSGSVSMRLFIGGSWLLVAARFVVPLSCASCSTTYQLGSMSGAEDKTEHTGSVRSAAAKPEAGAASPADLRFLNAAAAEVLSQGGKDASLPWENPGTGARGTVTPLAARYPHADGTICQEFLASHVQGAREAWYQGEACQRGPHWETREVRPLQRS